MIALSLRVVRERRAYRDAHHAEWLYIQDGDEKLVLSTKPQSSSSQVSLETMLVNVDVPPGEPILCQRLRLAASKDGAPAPHPHRTTLRPIAQLRAPYAEQVLALAGRHLSRIGTDYVGIDIG